MSKLNKAKIAEIEQEKESLRELLKPGDTIYTDLKHVSKSGMLRIIALKIVKDGDILDISYGASMAMNSKLDKDQRGIKITGCGMDMGFALVYELSQYLYPKGFECIGQNCPSNDHFNGDRNYNPHHHESGGYALKQRWL